ncbi:hypothetical protein NDU88_003024 [Pleurodeles waltl]|uniref:Uncharacterized protein n=1 Tax=Pleurodeles waltl TaxID=8319 RepID=A0AAV7QBN1_PLEWA|nr:hypothetical protein NDU88_003024 [Pleurodeles waltl]
MRTRLYTLNNERMRMTQPGEKKAVPVRCNYLTHFGRGAATEIEVQAPVVKALKYPDTECRSCPVPEQSQLSAVCRSV